MDSWRKVLIDGFLPLMPTRGLEAVVEAIRNDSPELLQRATTTPPPLQCVQDWPVEAACFTAYCGWKGMTLETDTVGDVEEFFARVCYEVDQAIGEPAACRYFLNFWDETPRLELFTLMLPIVEDELKRRI